MSLYGKNEKQMPFDVVVADPPWSYIQAGRGKTPYSTMKTSEICALGSLIKQLRHKHAPTFLWGTWPQLVDVVEVMKAWGSPYKTLAFLWCKTVKSSETLAFRMSGGSYTRANSEPCFLGKDTRFRYPREDKGVRQIIHEESEIDHIFQPISTHSTKPDEFYERVERLYPNARKLELFARVSRPGWTCLGNEIDGLDIKVALKDLIFLEGGEASGKS